jgi:SAM-dependent methyltransferase
MTAAPEHNAVNVQWERVPCPFCDSEKASFFEHEGWQWPTHYVRCRECGLIYLQPMPRLDEAYLKSLYGSLPEGLERYEMENFTLDRMEPIHRRRYEESLDAISEAHPEPGTLVDVGAGNGALQSLAQKRGWKGIGIEVGEYRSRIAREKFGLDVRTGTLESANLPEACADAIAMRHVLEHVEQPAKLILEAKRILRSGGVLLIECPNPLSWEKAPRYWWRRLVHGRKTWRPRKMLPMHLVAFPPRALAIKAEQMGFGVCSLRTYSHAEHHSGPGLALLRAYHKLALGSKFRLVLKKT